MPTTDFYSRIGDSVFDAGYRAPEDVVTAANNGTPECMSTSIGQRQDFVQAFVAAVVRCAEKADNPSAWLL